MTPEEIATQDRVVAELTAAAETEMFSGLMQSEYDLPELAETYEEAQARMVANRYLGALAAIVGDMNSNEQALKSEVEFLRGKYGERNGALERRAAWLREQVERVSQFVNYPKGAKSLSLPYGRMGYRKSRERLEVVDGEKLESWCRIYAPDALEEVIEVRIDKQRVNALVKNEQDANVRALLDSGVVIVHHATDEFYVSPTIGDTPERRQEREDRTT